MQEWAGLPGDLADGEGSLFDASESIVYYVSDSEEGICMY